MNIKGLIIRAIMRTNTIIICSFSSDFSKNMYVFKFALVKEGFFIGPFKILVKIGYLYYWLLQKIIGLLRNLIDLV